jgi:hypothetical protein
MKPARWILLLVVVVCAATAALVLVSRDSSVKLTTSYQAVLLTNGSVYYGKIEGLGKPYPILRDVFYIQTGVDQATKQTSNVLVRRGKEWHGPDYMVLNANHVLLVEPVTPGSRVAQLIAAAPK